MENKHLGKRCENYINNCDQVNLCPCENYIENIAYPLENISKNDKEKNKNYKKILLFSKSFK